MILKELLDQTYPYEKETDYMFVFKDGNDKTIFVRFDDSADIFQLDFARVSGDRFGITGDGDAFKILATVALIAREWLKKNKPPAFYFTAEEPSRKKLYDRLVKRLDGFDGYHRVQAGQHYKFLKDMSEDFEGEIYYFENPKYLSNEID